MLVRGQNYSARFFSGADIHKSSGDYYWVLRHQVGYAVD